MSFLSWDPFCWRNSLRHIQSEHRNYEQLGISLSLSPPLSFTLSLPNPVQLSLHGASQGCRGLSLREFTWPVSELEACPTHISLCRNKKTQQRCWIISYRVSLTDKNHNECSRLLMRQHFPNMWLIEFPSDNSCIVWNGEHSCYILYQNTFFFLPFAFQFSFSYPLSSHRARKIKHLNCITALLHARLTFLISL